MTRTQFGKKLPPVASVQRQEPREVSVLVCGFYFNLIMISLGIVSSIFHVLIPSIMIHLGNFSSSAVFVLTIYFTYRIFVSRNGRLLQTIEYWAIVLISTASVLAILFAQIFLADLTGLLSQSVKELPFFIMASIFLITVLFVFAVNAVGYSSLIGNRLLRAKLAG